MICFLILRSLCSVSFRDLLLLVLLSNISTYGILKYSATCLTRSMSAFMKAIFFSFYILDKY
jgi:hypothetical protein